MLRRHLNITISAMACLGAACVVSACGASSSATTTERPALARPVAAALAGQTRVVETRLAKGDDCGAAAAVKLLERQAARAVAERQIPRSLAVPLRASIHALSGRIVCAPATNTTTENARSRDGQWSEGWSDSPGDEHGKKAHGKAHEKKAHEKKQHEKKRPGKGDHRKRGEGD